MHAGRCHAGVAPYLSQMQSAFFMCPTLLAPVACVDVLYFPTLSHKLKSFRDKSPELETCASILDFRLKTLAFQEFSQMSSYMYVGIHLK
jgi:hypothetical protein